MVDPEKRCRIVHAFLMSGSCPYCERPVERGAVADVVVADPARWDIAAMTAALDGPDEEARDWASRCMGWLGSSLEEALPLFRRGLEHANRLIQFATGHDLYHIGESMSPDQLDEIERQSAAHPDEFAYRLILLGGDFMGRHQDEDVIGRRPAHIHWVIANRPDSPVAAEPFCMLFPGTSEEDYQLGADLWHRNVRERRTEYEVVVNAAHYFALSEPDSSERYFEMAKPLDPTNPKPYVSLGNCYYLRSIRASAENRTALLRRAMVEFEGGFVREKSSMGRESVLIYLVKTAFAVGDFVRTRDAATKLLAESKPGDDPPISCDATHFGHIALGHLALCEGDIERTREHLRIAGHPPGPRWLMAFGPDVSLARRLLDRGENDAVIDYLERCKAIENDRAELDRWIDDIRDGRPPEFHAHQYYFL